MKRLALFDIDCTLLDAHGAGGRAIRRALTETYGRWQQSDGYTYHGRTDPQIVRDLAAAGGVPPAEIEAGMEACLDAYVRFLRSEVAAGAVEVLPGVSELVTTLTDDDRVVLGLLTGNIIGGAEVKLAPTGFGDLFKIAAYGSDSAHRPDLPRSSCVVRRSSPAGVSPARRSW